MIRPRVAILIVTYNSRKFLPDLFGSLRRCTDLADVSIVVVDNASTDGTLEALRAEAADLPALEVLAQPDNVGFAAGNNVALARARALGVPYALLLNPDTEVTPGWLDELLGVMEARPEVAAAQPLLMLWGDPERINSAGNVIHFCGFTYCGGYRKSKAEMGLNGQVTPVTYATGAALLLRMSALDEVGDFDERLFLYLEECDLQMRLRQRGFECVLVPSARVLHKYTDTFSPQKYAWLERNRWMILLKHWPTRRLVAVGPALLATELAVLGFAAMSGWLPEKLQTYVEVARHLPSTLSSRRQIQSQRADAATDARYLTGVMDHPGFEHPIVTRLANPLLSAYWRVAQRVLGLTGE